MNYRLDPKQKNAHIIVKDVRKLLRSAGASDYQIMTFQTRALEGSFDNLIRVVKRTVNVTE